MPILTRMQAAAQAYCKRIKDTYDVTNFIKNHGWQEYRPCSLEEIEDKMTKLSLHTQVSADDVFKMLSEVHSNALN